MSHADTYGEGGTATQAEHERDRKIDMPYSVNYWGSHPDADNDDCYTGEDYSTKEAALAAFNGEVQDPPNMPGYYIRCVAFIEIDGPDINEVRPNPSFKAERVDRTYEQQESAMQAGMAFGVHGYNDAMGYDSEEYDGS